MTYDKTTRTLHRLLAAGVVLQLLTSLVMTHPSPGHSGNFLFTIHETIGLLVLVVMGTHWAVSLPKYRATPHFLFPWTSRAGIDAVVADARLYAQGFKDRRLPDAEVPTPLPGAVQGLGLILVSVMAVTGTFVFLGLEDKGEISLLGWMMVQVHELVAPLLWLYLIGHVGAAVTRQVFGDPVITKMFRHKEN